MHLNEILNIKYPLIQGGMANIATGEFAASVSNAGGLGLVGAGGMDLVSLKENIKKCRAMTDKPFGVNIMLLHPQADAMAELVVQEKVPVVTTGAGNPAKYIERWKQAGILIFPVVPTVSLAKRMERLGVTGVIAEGTESGGHIGEMASMTLIPQVVDAVQIPVVAAGGIGNGRQLLATKVLGACGVQVGTCLLVADECPIHEKYKDAIIKAKDTSITVMGRMGGIPVRVIKNPMAKKYLDLEKRGADKEELEKFTLGSLKKAVYQGDTEQGSLMAGQVAAQIIERKPVKQIIDGLFLEYEQVLEKLCREVHSNKK